MKAIRIHQWGNLEVVKLEQAPTPVLNNNEVLIEVHAASVNPIDCKVRIGYLSALLTDCFPMTLGWDFSGVVQEVKSTSTQFKKGDEVFGLIKFPQPAGTYAEYLAAPIEQICHKPKTIDHIHAAATPLVALTAWQGLFEYAQLQAGQTVLIHAAGGSVGQVAVQLAKWKGAKVIACASETSKKILQAYGVDQFIDYKTEKFDEVLKNIDVVFDPLGGDNSIRSISVLKSGGKLVPLLRAKQEEVTEKAKEKNIDLTFMMVKPNGEQLDIISHLIDDQIIQIPVEKIFSLEDVKSAFELVETGHCHGKVVLEIK